jgi:hypothetical protein
MSTLLTTLTSMAYCDQIPQFQKTDNVTQVFFTPMLLPQSHHGFAAVVIVVEVHVLLVTSTLLVFAIYSRYTLLGNQC